MLSVPNGHKEIEKMVFAPSDWNVLQKVRQLQDLNYLSALKRPAYRIAGVSMLEIILLDSLFVSHFYFLECYVL